MNNDGSQLMPRTSFEGPALTFDWPALHIGSAEYDEGPTGCTVFYFPKRAITIADVRGGSPGTMMQDAGACDAICYAGGSLLGLEAATGVAAEIHALRGHKTDWMSIPCVQGAILFDFGGRSTAVYPDKELGRAALRAAQPGVFPLGARGAGRNASVGKGFDFSMAEPCGQGGAFRQVRELKVAVFSVINAIGAIIDRDGRVVRGHRDPHTGERKRIDEILDERIAAAAPASAAPGNTTLTVVATNQQLSPRDLTQIGRQVHASMARCIQPFHTQNDGDILITATTNEVRDRGFDPTAVGVLASELAWDAVLSSFA
jgi:L-aminopeptidase/D-esterase-like protein